MRTRRLEPDELPLAARRGVRREPESLALRSAAGPALDLESRIALAADLQATAGNAATTAALGEVRTDKPQAPAGGVKAIMDLGSGGQRGLTRSSFDANKMPLFKVQRPALEGASYTTRAVVPRLPEPDHEVYWPAPGRHLIGPYGKGKRYLELSRDWSDKLLAGESRHVEDMDLAYAMTWGRVRDVLAEMAQAEKPYTGATPEAARDAAWKDFQKRLPAGFRPEGPAPTKEAQERVWGPDDKGSVFTKLWKESGRARDASGDHTPDQSMKLEKGNDRIDELSDGKSHIPGPESKTLMDEAWRRIVKG
jgi:hypothetical protein